MIRWWHYYHRLSSGSRHIFVEDAESQRLSRCWWHLMLHAARALVDFRVYFATHFQADTLTRLRCGMIRVSPPNTQRSSSCWLQGIYRLLHAELQTLVIASAEPPPRRALSCFRWWHFSPLYFISFLLILQLNSFLLKASSGLLPAFSLASFRRLRFSSIN